MSGLEQSGALPAVPGVALHEVLGEGASSLVYRGQVGTEHLAVKVLKTHAAGIDADMALRFRREASALGRLNHSALVRVREVGEHQGRPFLLMELVEGQSLERLLAKGPLDNAGLIKLAIALAGALAEVHRHGMVHRDLKPANVIIQQDGSPKIIDFGFAIQSELGDADDRRALSFLYGAPEQSGMLKRPVDGRSDLYALGAMLFECGAGHPPFEADTVSELLRMHLMAEVPRVTDVNPSISPVLADIIAKLLQKDPDDRYQTAGRLLRDLENMGQLEASLRAGHRVVLDRRGPYPDKTATETPLVGRQEQIAWLHEAWHRAQTGTAPPVLVRGDVGIGKTRLVQELLREITVPDVVIMTGRAHAAERTPLWPFREAIDSYLERLAVEPADVKENCLQRLRTAAQGMGALLGRLSPRLEQAFEGSQPLRALDGMAEETRYYETVALFLANLAAQHQGLILVLENIQWLDEGSLTVIRRLEPHREGKPFLLLALGRDDALSSAGMQRFATATQGFPAATLQLTPLAPAAAAELIAVHLGGRPLEPRGAEQLAALAQGNPFALGEYVRALLDEGMLQPSGDHWLLDGTRFHALSIPKDVVGLLINRLHELTHESLNVLSLAAVLGREFRIDLLRAAWGKHPTALQSGLDAALKRNLIEPAPGGFRFVHDEVQAACLNRLTLEQLRDFNQAAATAYESNNDGSFATTYALARHLMLGAVEAHRQRLCEVCAEAGRAALVHFANEDAFIFLREAINAGTLLGYTPQQLQPLRESAGLSCTRTGRYAEAHEHYKQALASATGPLQRARLQFLMGQAFANEGRNNEAWEQMRSALHELGVRFYEGPRLQKMSLLFYTWASRFLERTRWGFGSAQGDERVRLQLTAEICSMAFLLANFRGKPMFMAQAATRGLYYSYFIGAGVEHAKANACYALTQGQARRLAAARHYGQQGIAAAEKSGDPEAMAYCRGFYSVAVDAAGALLEGQQTGMQVANDMFKYCNAWEATAICLQVFLSYYSQNKCREALRWMDAYTRNLENSGVLGLFATGLSAVYAQNIILGNITTALQAKDKQQEIVRLVGNSVHIDAAMHANTLVALYERDDVGPGIEEPLRAFLQTGLGDYHRKFGFITICYIRLEQYRKATSEPARAESLQRFLAAVADLEARPLTPVHFCHLLILQSASLRERGKARDALPLLARAEDMARTVESLWGLWSAARERARTARVLGDPVLMRQAATYAMDLAAQEGWPYRLQMIGQEFGIDRANARPQSWKSAGSEKSVANWNSERYANALVRMSLAATSSPDPGQQTHSLLEEISKLLGAERAFFFTANAAGLAVQHQANRTTLGANDDARPYSQVVVERVRTTREPLVIAGTEEAQSLAPPGALTNDLRSIIAVPVMVREQMHGVLYLDSHVVKGLFTQDDVQILRAVGGFLAVIVEANRIARLQSFEKDLALTTAVQALFLPQTANAQIGRIKLRGVYWPASSCGGDWWWYDSSGTSLKILVGDVTGHGAASAMITAAASSMYRMIQRHGPGRDAATQLSELHDQIKAMVGSSFFVTASALVIDTQSAELEWLNAGGPAILIMAADGSVKPYASTGTPLGWHDTFELGRRTVALQPGDRLLLFTDGVYEIEQKNGNKLGMRRLSKLLVATRAMDHAAATKCLHEELRNCSAEDVERDDVTFVVVDVT